VTCVAMGSKLIGKDVVDRDFKGLTKKTKDTLALIRTLRK